MKKIILSAVVVAVISSFALTQANAQCGPCEGGKKKDKSKEKTEETDSKAPKKS